MEPYQRRSNHFEALFANPKLIWMGQNTNHLPSHPDVKRAMIAAILSQKGPGLQTEGNFNNRIGLPLTLLRARPEDGWAVLEMGMSEPGEIRTLAAMVRPAVRVITEVAAAHLEFFPDVEAIADANWVFRAVRAHLLEGDPTGAANHA